MAGLKTGFLAILFACLCFPGNAAPAKAKWTVMLYIKGSGSGHKDVEAQLKQRLSALAATTRPAGVNIVAEASFSDWPAAAYFCLSDTANNKALYQAKLGFFDKLTGKKPQTYIRLEETVKKAVHDDMTDWKHAAAFVDWAKEQYPAERYIFVFFGHGLGWKDPKPHKMPAARGMLFDYTTMENLATADIGKIFAGGRRVDIILTNSCMMQSMESAYQMRNSADYILGSEHLLPHSLYLAWTSAVSAAANRPDLGTEGMAKEIFGNFSSYADYDCLTFSAIKTSALPELAQAINGFVAAALQSTEFSMFRDIRDSVTRSLGLDGPGLGSYADLGDLMNRIIKQSRSAGLRDASAAVLAAMQKAVAANIAYGEDGFGTWAGHGTGLTIDIPCTNRKADPEEMHMGNRYGDLDFGKDTKWDLFRKMLLEKTQ